MVTWEQRLGAVVRRLRRRRGWRQVDLARVAGCSPATISRIERGDVGTISIDRLRRVCAALDIRLDLVPRWHGADLDRMLSARHAALGERIAERFRLHRDWVVEPEVSFSIWGERGIVDLLAWNPRTRSLLVIELKTELVDINETIGTLDRKGRLARQIAESRGWSAADATVSTWLVLAAGRTNERRVTAHRALLDRAYPDDGRILRGWLRRPTRPIRCLSFIAETPAA